MTAQGKAASGAALQPGDSKPAMEAEMGAKSEAGLEAKLERRWKQ